MKWVVQVDKEEYESILAKSKAFHYEHERFLRIKKEWQEWNNAHIDFIEFKDIMKTLRTMNDQIKYCFDTTDRLNRLNRRRAKLEDSFCNVNHVIRDTMIQLKHSLDISEIKVTLKLNSRLPHVAISKIGRAHV